MVEVNESDYRQMTHAKPVLNGKSWFENMDENPDNTKDNLSATYLSPGRGKNKTPACNKIPLETILSRTEKSDLRAHERENHCISADQALDFRIHLQVEKLQF